MEKENSKRGAGLRRSALLEMMCLREEWSALKGVDTSATALRPHNARNDANHKTKKKITTHTFKENTNSSGATSEVLRGVVALVEVGAESRALALRAALAALGATVAAAWSPLVTHLVWAHDGCRSTRAKARLLASHLVSPLWVEACAATAARQPEAAFPAATRPSDRPSPRTLRVMLKRAEMQLTQLSGDTKTDSDNDTSADVTADTSHDNTTEAESRVNTAPRRALPMSHTPSPPPDRKARRQLFHDKDDNADKNNLKQGVPSRVNRAKPAASQQTKKSQRKLYTHKDDDDDSTDDGARPAVAKARLTPRDKKCLARAERMARRMLAAASPHTHKAKKPAQAETPRIVLTGMSSDERRTMRRAIRTLKGRLQKQVNRKTTHVIFGSFRKDPNCPELDTTPHKPRTLNALAGAARGCMLLHKQWIADSVAAKVWLPHSSYQVTHFTRLSQKARIERKALCLTGAEYGYNVFNGLKVHLSTNVQNKDAVIHLVQLCGGVIQYGGPTEIVNTQNGCPGQNGGLTGVGNTQNGGRGQNGGLTGIENTQNGQTLGRTQITQNGGSCRTQNGGRSVIVGTGDGEISSKWVFDSVEHARTRTITSYINVVRNNIQAFESGT